MCFNKPFKVLRREDHVVNIVTNISETDMNSVLVCVITTSDPWDDKFLKRIMDDVNDKSRTVVFL